MRRRIAKSGMMALILAVGLAGGFVGRDAMSAARFVPIPTSESGKRPYRHYGYFVTSVQISAGTFSANTIADKQ